MSKDYDAERLLFYKIARDMIEIQGLWGTLTGKDKTEEEREHQRWRRRINRFNYLKVLFGIFNWRYVLLPIGVMRITHRYFLPNRRQQDVVARCLYIFGIRVARWVVEVKGYREVVEPPKVLFRRHRRRKSGVGRTYG